MKTPTRSQSAFQPLSRRQAVAGMSAAFFSVRGLFAEEMSKTPGMTEGPFYPDRLPLDTDNDLIIVGDELTPALGTVYHLSGRVFSTSGEPVRSALVEIWQVDNNGMYIHTGSAGQQRDANFQGYGRFLTGGDGRYYFRTIRPVPYPGRTPHIHVAVSIKGKRQLTTQLMFDGDPNNGRDGLLNRLSDAERKFVLTKPVPVASSKIGEIQSDWDIVIGATPQDRA